MNKQIKTFEAWEKSHLDGSSYLKAGDYVDDKIVMYFAEVVPPKIFTKEVVQCGEPYDHQNGLARYTTFFKETWQDTSMWVYAGLLTSKEASLFC